MATALTIPVGPLTAEAFSPFGEVILVDESLRLRTWSSHASAAETGGYAGHAGVYPGGHLDSDHPVDLLLMRNRLREFRVNFLERHLEIRQAMIGIDGNPFALVVAQPNAREENGLPGLDELRAFLVPSAAGVNLWRGTWHEVPFPLVDGGITLITTHPTLTEGLVAPLDERGEIHVGDVDKRNVLRRSGTIVRIDPQRTPVPA